MASRKGPTLIAEPFPELVCAADARRVNLEAWARTLLIADPDAIGVT